MTVKRFKQVPVENVVSIIPENTTEHQRTCLAKVRWLFRNLPLRTGAEPEVFLKRLSETRECDAVTPFLAEARGLCEAELKGSTPFSTVWHNESDIESALRKELWGVGKMDYLMYYSWRHRGSPLFRW